MLPVSRLQERGVSEVRHREPLDDQEGEHLAVQDLCGDTRDVEKVECLVFQR